MEAVYAANRTWGLRLTQEQLALLEQYGRLLVGVQGRLNVIGPATAAEIAVRHLVDSLAGLPVVRRTRGEIVDVGSGGGLPGVVLQVGLAGRTVVLLEARQKKVDFLRDVVRRLGLSGVEVVWGRAEEFGRGAGQGRFGCAVSRAVGRLELLVRYGMPLLQPGGVLVAWKGPAVEQELAAADKLAARYGGGPAELVPYSWEGLGRRYLVVIDKVKPAI